MQTSSIDDRRWPRALAARHLTPTGRAFHRQEEAPAREPSPVLPGTRGTHRPRRPSAERHRRFGTTFPPPRPGPSALGVRPPPSSAAGGRSGSRLHPSSAPDPDLGSIRLLPLLRFTSSAGPPGRRPPPGHHPSLRAVPREPDPATDAAREPSSLLPTHRPNPPPAGYGASTRSSGRLSSASGSPSSSLGAVDAAFPRLLSPTRRSDGSRPTRQRGRSATGGHCRWPPERGVPAPDRTGRAGRAVSGRYGRASSSRPCAAAGPTRSPSRHGHSTPRLPDRHPPRARR